MDSPVAGSYRIYGWWKRLLFVVAGFMILVGLGLLIAAIRSGSAGQVAFVLVWMGVAVFLVHQVYERIGSALTLSDGMLTWIPPSGRAVTKPLVQLRSVRRWRGASGSVSLLTFSDGSSLRVWVRKGFSDFVALLQEEQPDLDVRLSAYGRLADRWGMGGSGYERE